MGGGSSPWHPGRFPGPSATPRCWRCCGMPRGVEVLGEVRERVWAAVRAGAHLRQAAESVGVSYDAARGWLADCGGVIPAPSRAGRSGCAYRRLSIGDRETIGLMLAAGHTVTEIADEVEVHKVHGQPGTAPPCRPQRDLSSADRAGPGRGQRPNRSCPAAEAVPAGAAARSCCGRAEEEVVAAGDLGPVAS